MQHLRTDSNLQQLSLVESWSYLGATTQTSHSATTTSGHLMISEVISRNLSPLIFIETWTLITANATWPPRSHHLMETLPNDAGLVIAGGSGLSNDTNDVFLAQGLVFLSDTTSSTSGSTSSTSTVGTTGAESTTSEVSNAVMLMVSAVSVILAVLASF
jgi:hypothetical protein